ncbi:MAG: hypothetical protein NVS4B3_14710 [Gemmatimonadaceae bacterium]
MSLLRSAAVLAVALAGCVSSTTRYYIPDAAQPRLNLEELRDRADRLVRVECPRLLTAGQAQSGVARLVLELAPSGEVIRARIDRSSGDERMDTIFGALAAQLTVDPLTGAIDARGSVLLAGPGHGPAESADAPRRRATEGRISIGYSCAPGAGVVTVELNR